MTDRLSPEIIDNISRSCIQLGLAFAKMAIAAHEVANAVAPLVAMSRQVVSNDLDSLSSTTERH